MTDKLSEWQQFASELATVAADVRAQMNKDVNRSWTMPDLVAETGKSSHRCTSMIVRSIWFLQGEGEVTYGGDLNLVLAGRPGH